MFNFLILNLSYWKVKLITKMIIAQTDLQKIQNLAKRLLTLQTYSSNMSLIYEIIHKISNSI